jgi:hypothetical protein
MEEPFRTPCARHAQGRIIVRPLYVPPSSNHRGQPGVLSENGSSKLVGGKHPRRVASLPVRLWYHHCHARRTHVGRPSHVRRGR